MKITNTKKILISLSTVISVLLACMILPHTASAVATMTGDGFGGTDITTSNSAIINTDLNQIPPQTQEEALNADFPLGGDTSLSDKSDGSTIEGIIKNFARFLNRLAPFIVALTVLVFIWGLLQMVRAGSDDARKEGKQIIFFGIIALFVMVSVWGLVNILVRSFQLDSSRAPQGPGVPRYK